MWQVRRVLIQTIVEIVSEEIEGQTAPDGSYRNANSRARAQHRSIRVNSCTPPYTTHPIGGRKGAPRKKHDPSMNPILRMSRPSLTMCGFNSASTDSIPSVSSSAASSCSSIRAKSTGTSLNYYDQTGPSRSKRRWPNPARKRASQQEASDGEDPPRVICLPKGTCRRGDP